MNFVEQMVSGVTRKNVTEAWFNTHANKCKQTALFPFFMSSQLRMTKRDANLFIRICWVGHTQVHGHVEVVALRSEARFENWLVEPRITCVDNDVGFCAGDQRDERLYIASINSFCREFPRIIKLSYRLFRALPRNVGQHKGVKEPPSLSNRGH